MKCEDKNYYLTLIIEALGLCVYNPYHFCYRISTNQYLD